MRAAGDWKYYFTCIHQTYSVRFGRTENTVLMGSLHMICEHVIIEETLLTETTALFITRSNQQYRMRIHSVVKRRIGKTVYDVMIVFLRMRQRRKKYSLRITLHLIWENFQRRETEVTQDFTMGCLNVLEKFLFAFKLGIRVFLIRDEVLVTNRTTQPHSVLIHFSKRFRIKINV